MFTKARLADWNVFAYCTIRHVIIAKLAEIWRIHEKYWLTSNTFGSIIAFSAIIYNWAAVLAFPSSIYEKWWGAWKTGCATSTWDAALDSCPTTSACSSKGIVASDTIITVCAWGAGCTSWHKYLTFFT